jgi:hypothetical protein
MGGDALLYLLNLSSGAESRLNGMCTVPLATAFSMGV